MNVLKCCHMQDNDKERVRGNAATDLSLNKIIFLKKTLNFYENICYT